MSIPYDGQSTDAGVPGISSEKYLCEGYSGNLNSLLQLDVIAELL